MVIDNSTKFKVGSRIKTDVYSLDRLTTFVKDRAKVKRIVELIMADPIEVGRLLRFNIQQKVDAYIPCDAISRSCLYLAVCCYINKTSACKPLIDDLLDNYELSIEGSSIPAKDILKEIVNISIDKYEYVFNEVAKELGII